MTNPQRRKRTGLTWALIGGAVLIAAIVALVVNVIVGAATGPSPRPTPSPSLPPGSTAPPTETPGSIEVVDPDVAEAGWLPEPITTDPEMYARAALAAASTFDTTLSTREEWLDYLDTWFTPDTRYTDPSDQAARMKAARLELRQGVVLPQEMWDSIAQQDGRVIAAVTGDVRLADVPQDAAGDMRIATANAELTFTQSDGAGGEASYPETVRVSVQVLCGEASVPTPGTAQQAGHCKVVRYFTEPVEG
ncbi:hypothetical protein FVP74_07595 [Microbacterium saccharophilum]|uniref:Uncharacterized protein n=1 Tax=Microbacterium saccharophilum TaxID=1213358 RepID=A0A5C8I0P8_9MICO|nr:hypothetical protein [Microbacterium saccharophilum]TXK11202.1 hypothetical protein FVP74_07595 [Microbacterium saccharophilum]GEP49131.1 hypothetical protein MSA03_26390 [Microbacterium saccharophilum]